MSVFGGLGTVDHGLDVSVISEALGRNLLLQKMGRRWSVLRRARRCSIVLELASRATWLSFFEVLACDEVLHVVLFQLQG